MSCALGAALSTVASIVGTAGAQSPVPAPKRVLHLCVDPRFGSDALAGGAAALNPNGPPPGSTQWCLPSIPQRPHEVINSFGQVLLWAPHPFKTITAAIDYIVATSPGAGQPLPASGPAVVWEHAVIHLMPGVYGLRPAMTPQTFGQPQNDESFPLFVPPNVSIRGASALNTTLVVDAGNSPAFHFGVDHFFASAGRTIAINGENTFIDGLTITGGIDSISSGARRHLVCGIWVAGDVASRPTITNCVFRELWVGVGVGASRFPGVEHDGLTLANDTFVWNRIGLWNGVDVDPLLATGTETGRSAINVLNCLFDATPWAAGLLSCSPPSVSQTRNGSVDFEGVTQSDLRALIGGVAQDTNAWELDKHNFTAQTGGGSILPGLAPTRPRGALPAMPRVNLSPFTGAQGLGTPLAIRGVLFVRDLLCRPQFAGSNFDRSPHDFRLAPNVAHAAASQLLNLAELNPLVDAGFSDSAFSNAGAITFENGNVLADPPGFLSLGEASQASWAFHCWEFDLEGYGNPRIVDHSEYPNAPFAGVPAGDPIDIGADEVGQLIIAGYADRTTELRKETSGTALANERCWYLGPISGANPPTALTPFYRALPHLPVSAWPTSTYFAPATWHTSQVRRVTDPVPAAAAPVPGQPLAIVYPATMADVTPHLLPDIHPWWATRAVVGGVLFVPPALTLWEECLGGFHNAAVYQDPVTGRINPPAAAEGTLPSFTWLDGREFIDETLPVSVFPFGQWSGFSLIVGFDAVCRGVDPQLPLDVVTNPGTTPTGSNTPSTLRFTVEFDNTNLETRLFDMPSNLQSFTIWSDEASSS
ncbi:MAG: hypothetical protein IPM29_05140 [Planctomycetes bacterium]|nr:hypothetical protein [Planctomycetota bacterium]